MGFPIFIENHFSKMDFPFLFSKSALSKLVASKIQNRKDGKILENAFILRNLSCLWFRKGPLRGGSCEDIVHGENEAQEEHDGSTNAGERPPLTPPPKKKKPSERQSRESSRHDSRNLIHAQEIKHKK